MVSTAFSKQVFRVGIVTVSISIVANFTPVLYFWLFLGIIPPVADIFKIWGVAAAAFATGWIVQPISYFPVLGMAGSYIAWVSGNVSSLKLPASLMAQQAANVEPGTPEGEVISLMGLATSVFVSVSIVTIFVFIGSWLLPMLPPGVHKSLKYIIPAIYGGLYVFLCLKYLAMGLIIMVLAMLLISGAMIIGMPSWLVVIVNIILGSVISIIFAKRVKQK
jgi:hypothetical protein